MKTVLITGAAQGIGRATALELAKAGYAIVINYLTSAKEAEELRKTIAETYSVPCLTV